MPTTILSRLHDHARIRPGAVAYREHRDGAWRDVTWGDYREQVRRTARALIALGVEPGQTVAILGGNRPQWVVMALGAMACRAVAVGIYVTSSAEQVAYVAGHAEARVLLVDGEEQLAKVEAVRRDLPALEQVVTMDPSPAPTALSWDGFLARSQAVTEGELDDRLAAVGGDDLATLIYTSGTTGQPKGVMLSHRNLAATARLIVESFDVRDGVESTLSYLPLAHIAEQMASIHLAVYAGCTVCFVPSPERLPDALREIQPSVFFGVPRVWERFHAALLERLAGVRGLKRKLADWALGIGRRGGELRNRGRRPRGLLALQGLLADRLVLAKIRRRLGFSRMRFCVSGAAPIAAEILDFFSALGITIYEVWGLSESCGPGTWNQPGKTRFGTVGPPLPEVEVAIEDDGEILLRGPNVFQGYFRDPEQTAATLVDGWLRTGDLGRFDPDGYLIITGRKKEILITSGGKNVAPSGIESQLKRIELVADAVVIGDRRRFLSALLSLEPEALARWAGEHGVTPAAAVADRRLLAALQAEIDRVNARLSRVEQVRAFRLLPRPLTVEDGELTPTLKLKRRVVEERYAELIEDLYR